MTTPSSRRLASRPWGAGHRVFATIVATLALLVLAGVGSPTPLHAQAADPTTTAVESDGQSPAGNILPRPGSGQAPDSPNDPGGWMQYLVFGVILAGIAIIVLLVVRESRNAKGNRTGTGRPA